MRIVIVGASGNLGTALLQALQRIRPGMDDVVGVARRDPTDAAAPSDVYSTADWVQADISTPESAATLRSAFEGADVVVHLGWQLQPSHDRDQLVRTNVDGSARVFSAAQHAGAPHLVYASSAGTYAPAEPGTWADESWPTTGVPSSHYSMDKAAVERLLPGVTATNVAMIRPGLVLQPAAAAAISRYFLGRFLPSRLVHPALLRVLPWPTDLQFQVVHADDVAAAIVAIIERQATGAFNLAAEPLLDRKEFRSAFGGFLPPVPLGALRAVVGASWRLRLQPTDAGWLIWAAGCRTCGPTAPGLSSTGSHSTPRMRC